MIKVMKMMFVTDKVELVNNHLPPGQFKIEHQLRRNTGRLNEKMFFTQLALEIKDKEGQKTPVTMTVVIKALFEFDHPENTEEITEFLKIQGVNILYPYLRSMVTNLALNAMMPPIILPIIDASELFKANQDISQFVN